MNGIKMQEVFFVVWSGFFTFESGERHCFLVTYTTQLLDIIYTFYSLANYCYKCICGSLVK